MDQAARGKRALTEGSYQQAIENYTAALKESPTSPDYLIQRSTAHQRAKNYASALADANNAVLNAQKRAKREFIIEAQFRRGCALYSLERYGDAEFVFGVVKRMDEKHKMVPTWMQKTKMAIDKLDGSDEKKKCNVKETPEKEEASEVKESAGNAASSTNCASAAPAVQTKPTPTAPQQTPADKIRHEWYQNTESVYFTLLAKGVPKAKAQIDIQERSLSISFPLATGSSFDLTLEPLYGAVNPEKCIIRVLATKIEVILSKATVGQKWNAIESSEPVTASTADSTFAGATNTGEDAVKQAVLSNPNQPATGPAYPTSSKSGPKNWDKVVSDVRKADSNGKGDEDDDMEGGDEANAFFKKLFKGASPETQRAMMKSYTESNGTALSTNWDEVSKGKVETLPPDGMEAKPWS
ncbi:Cochaperone protein [Vermiconidia calcicola]|uniref:Cochaperone protein n=1 Tax=Vermiconidia calcicola TaxID=1690605 RepID=A0ACC3MMH9_9PEZI|nr:Cochaperone protein [Vermiconidia calcicola]